jgi:predicted nucleotidyltransferase
MHTSPITQEQVLAAAGSALAELPGVLALWHGGSAATGRLDELSDIDLLAIVQPGLQDEAFAAVELALERLAGIHTAWRVPEPAWHGQSQRCYRLRDQPEHLMVDLVLFTPETFEPHWLDPERHGAPLVLLDRAGLLVPAPFDAAAHRARMQARLEDLRGRVPVVGHLPGKALARGHGIDALAGYRRLLLEPLVELLGMQHRPLTFDFGMRYLYSELPPDLVDELERLSFVGSHDDLEEAIAGARAWITELLADIDVDAIPLEELSADARARVGIAVEHAQA